jgi:hypothetical protein
LNTRTETTVRSAAKSATTPRLSAASTVVLHRRDPGDRDRALVLRGLAVPDRRPAGRADRFTVERGRVVAIDVVADPEKLRGLPAD